MSTICDDLRAAILQAAMQGKLTEQLPEDGNAKELLSQIKDKKAKLNIKKKELVISEGEILFEIPDNWSWEKLENISQFLGDKNNQIKESATLKNGKYKVVSQSKELYIGYCNDEKRVLKITNPVLVFGDHTALVKYIDFDFVIGADGVKVISPFCIDIKYLYYALKYNLIGVNELGGYSRHYKFIKDKLIPIPPLAEQKRIVEKVDELMARVADLEQSADALASLKKAFPDDIKASLLQAAMQGKLTKQLPEDGSAEDLLEEIKAEKEKLIAEGKIKKQKPLAPITDDEIPFNIPANWKWERFGNLGSYRKGPFGSALTKSIFVKDSVNAIKVYEQKNAIKKDASLGDYFISREYYEDKMKNFRVLPGDIIVSCAGTIGETYILPEGIREGIINQALMRMRMFNGIYIPYFLIYFDYIIKASAISNSKGSAIKNIPPFEVLYMYPVAIPPLAEQKRIVERLDTLMQNINVVEDLIASE